MEEKHDAYYYHQLYEYAAAKECKSLEQSMNFICEECGSGYNIVGHYVEMHEKDATFPEEVFKLGFIGIARLFLILLQSNYNIFVPWLKREVLELLEENPKDLSDTEQDYQRSIKNWYNYYKKNWDNVDETLD